MGNDAVKTPEDEALTVDFAAQATEAAQHRPIEIGAGASQIGPFPVNALVVGHDASPQAIPKPVISVPLVDKLL
jgi:hypothetical protein